MLRNTKFKDILHPKYQFWSILFYDTFQSRPTIMEKLKITKCERKLMPILRTVYFSIIVVFVCKEYNVSTQSEKAKAKRTN